MSLNIELMQDPQFKKLFDERFKVIKKALKTLPKNDLIKLITEYQVKLEIAKLINDQRNKNEKPTSSNATSSTSNNNSENVEEASV